MEIKFSRALAIVSYQKVWYNQETCNLNNGKGRETKEMGNFGTELIVILLGAIGTLFKTFRFVQEGEMGIKLRFGRALKDKDGKPRIINPGFVFLIPFVETLKRHHVRQQTLRLDNQKIMIKRGLIFNVSAVVFLRVKDIYRALFEIDDLDNSLGDLSMGVLRDILAHKDYSELSDLETISEELLGKLQEKAEEWGVTFMQFKLTDCAPTPETAPLVNAEAAVKLKIQALRKAAEETSVPLEDMSPVFAAALVGIPMVTAITPSINLELQQNAGSNKGWFLKAITEGAKDGVGAGRSDDE